MKLEVIECLTQKTIDTYFVPNFSMLDFQEWKESSKVELCLDCLSDTVANLDSKDSETNEPISNSQKVEFYLPDPIKNRVLSQLAKSQTGAEESVDQILDEVTERVSMPELKSSTILSAVVTEILQNHHPHSKYKVRIFDG